MALPCSCDKPSPGGGPIPICKNCRRAICRKLTNMKYAGELLTGDFSENTMTFEIDGEMTLQAGKYNIEQIKEGDQEIDLDPNDLVETKDALNSAVSAIYFNDNSDYLSALYGVVRHLTGIEEPSEEDIKKLFKDLNSEE